MRRIAIINQKGGVGKTTTTANVGMALARAGHRVLLIDLDPQAHLTLRLGQDPAGGHAGAYEMLTGSHTVAKSRRKVARNLWMIGSSIDLAGAEVELVSVVGREVILRDLLDQHVESSRTAQYEYVIMDCPPSLGVLTLNGLCSANEVFIPLQPHYLALQGLSKLLETVSLVTRRINPALKVSGSVICMNEAGTKLAAEVIEDVRAFFEAARGTNVPWGNAKAFETVIRRNIKLAEAPSYGQSIFDYAPDSNGAKDYAQLAMEIDDPSGFAAMIEAKRKPKEEPKTEAAPAVEATPSPIENQAACAGIDPALVEPVKPEPIEAVKRKNKLKARTAKRKATPKTKPAPQPKGKPATPSTAQVDPAIEPPSKQTA